MFGFIDTYGSGPFVDSTQESIGPESRGENIAPMNWLTTAEYRRYLHWLNLKPTQSVLDVACGSGGPALYLAESAGCEVVGIDINSEGIAAADTAAHQRGMARQVYFLRADAGRPLPFADWRFDAVVCMDAVNLLPDRLRALREWRRVIRPGGRILFTDPAVITGLVTREELADRSGIGPCQFAAPGVNERLIQAAGLELEEAVDVTENAVRLSKRWHDDRSQRRNERSQSEGKETFDRLQRFLGAVHLLGSQRRLSRFAYVAHKPVPAGCEI